MTEAPKFDSNTGEELDGKALIERIPGDWAEPTRSIAETLAGAGHRAWVVGGGVRDLILGRPIKDIDLVSKALPDDVEALFPKTVAVGKSFGIVVVVQDGVEIEVATFREERGYSDRRRPDEIVYTVSLQDDAKRRDFTCNALFLDPLTGEIEDPEGGLLDLMKRRLSCVGQPADRFREDGLRLLRMARFLAALGLEPVEGLLDAARQERDSLDGVSPERVLDELKKMLKGPRGAVALEVMESCGLNDLCLPGWSTLDAAARHRRLGILSRLALGEGDSGGAVLIDDLAVRLAALFGDASGDVAAALEKLRASKDLRVSAEAIHELARQVLRTAALEGGAAAPGDSEERGRLVALRRGRYASAALTLAAAHSEGEDAERLAAYIGLLTRLAGEAPTEPVQLPAAELMELGVQKGPALGLALERLRHASLGGAFTDEEGARAWVREKVDAAP